VGWVALMALVLARIMAWLEIWTSSVAQKVEAAVLAMPLESSSEGTEA